ncbi:hypothetical protein F2Q68_00040993 [Brassica cretica]|uniref:Uncharacterized protein n=1 Tax=Brassica cretica TaxID=69181 RepID=A0A8S9MGF5_BRACR|nr:hypothetical protein F2Q68_00040993 [Brassica cretica]
MGDRDRLLSPVKGIQGSEVVVTKEGDQGLGIRNSVTVESTGSGSEMQKQNLSAPSTVSLEGGNQSIPINSDLKTGEWINVEKCAEVMKPKEVEVNGSETSLDVDVEDKTTTSKNENIMKVLEKTIEGSNKGSEGEKIWMDVSPGKASRTPAATNKLKFGQVSILSKSRFSVLSLDEEEGEITENNEVGG